MASAFPHPGSYQPNFGLSKREYYAAQAMNGLLSALAGANIPQEKQQWVIQEYARLSRIAADALAEELSA